MPCFRILTNIPKSNIPKDFVDKIIPVLASAVKKPVDGVAPGIHKIHEATILVLSSSNAIVTGFVQNDGSVLTDTFVMTNDSDSPWAAGVTSYQKFVCVISGDCHVSFAGDSSSPGAIASLESIGNLSPQENKVITTELTNFIQKELGIIPQRLFISYYDLQAHNIGKGGIILSDLTV